MVFHKIMKYAGLYHKEFSFPHIKLCYSITNNIMFEHRHYYFTGYIQNYHMLQLKMEVFILTLDYTGLFNNSFAVG